MPHYRILYKQTDYYHAWVEAVSESAARQAFIDFDIDSETFLEGENAELVEIEELDEEGDQ